MHSEKINTDQKIKWLIVAGLGILFIVSSLKNIPLAFDGSNPYDFPNYYFGGKRLFEGRPIYDFLDSEVYQSLGWHYKVYPADPPFTVILFSPLCLLSYSSAWVLWACISVLLLIISIYLVGREVRLQPTHLLLAIFLALSSKPFRFLLFSNHIETAVLFCSVAGWYLIRKQSYRAGLALWVIAANLKLFPLLLVVGSARLLGVRKALEAIVLFCVIFFFSGFLVGLENFSDFLFKVIPRSQLWYGAISNYSLISFGYALQAPILGWLLALFFFCFVIIFLLIKKSWNLEQYWTVVTISSMILSPLCWWRYLVLAFPCLLSLFFCSEIEISKRQRFTIAISVLILWGWPEFVDLNFYYLTVLISFFPLFAVLTLLGVSLNVTVRR